MNRDGALPLNLVGRVIFTIAASGVVGCSDATGPRRPTVLLPEPSFSVGSVETIDLGTLPGASSSNAFAVNADTQVVGMSPDATGSAFLWTPAQGMQELFPDVWRSLAQGINIHGTIVGWIIEEDPGSGHPRRRGFRRDPAGGLELLEHPFEPAAGSWPYAVNGVGEVVGWTNGFFFGNGIIATRAVRWDVSGTPEVLGSLGGASAAFDINEAGVIVGESLVSSTEIRAFRWTAATGMEPLPTPSGGFSSAAAINDDGLIAGWIKDDADSDTRAVIWTPTNEVIDLGTLGSSSFATSINNDGVVVGNSKVWSGEIHAFFWSPTDSTIRDLSRAPAEVNSISSNGLAVGEQDGRATLWPAVEACKLFEDPGPTDPLLLAPSIQEGVVTLADKSLWDHPILQRVERGAWIVEKGGKYTLLDFDQPRTGVPYNLCMAGYSGIAFDSIAADPTSRVVGQIHTHPVTSTTGYIPTPDNCYVADQDSQGNYVLRPMTTVQDSIEIAPTPSMLDDYAPWLMGVLDTIPGYMVNPDTLYRWTGRLPMNNLQRYPLAKGVNACIN